MKKEQIQNNFKKTRRKYKQCLIETIKRKEKNQQNNKQTNKQTTEQKDE